MTDDVERMLVCDVCSAEACFGFGVTLEGVRMGDVGSWRCAEHHPDRKAWYTREEWAQARAAGNLYPDASNGTEKINMLAPTQPAHEAAAE